MIRRKVHFSEVFRGGSSCADYGELTWQREVPMVAMSREDAMQKIATVMCSGCPCWISLYVATVRVFRWADLSLVSTIVKEKPGNAISCAFLWLLKLNTLHQDSTQNEAS